MSYLNKTASLSVADRLAQGVAAELKIRNPGTVDAVRAGLGMEEMSDTRRSVLTATESNVREIIADQLQLMKISTESLSAAQMDAAVAIGMAFADPVSYHRKATATGVAGGDGIKVFNSSNESFEGSYDFRGDYVASEEAFDKQVLNSYIGYSIAFNLGSARQDEFSEAFFPTVVVTPDQGGIDISARIQTVMNEVKRSLTGKPTDFSQRKLLDAYVDHTVLAADSLLCVPYYQTGSTNSSAAFVDPAKVPTRSEVVDGVGITTTALKIGVKNDLLGLSAHPTLMNNNVLDNTDTLDGRILLKRVYVAFQADTVNEEVVAFDVQYLQRTSFIKTAEGRTTEMALTANELSLIIATGINDKDVLGGTLAAFSGFDTAAQVLRLSVNLNGTADTEYGSVSVDSSAVTVASVSSRATGALLDLGNAGVISNITALGAIKVLGYDLVARRTNSNRRSRGLQGNSTTVVERHQIQLGSPLTMPAPVSSTDSSTASEIDLLIDMGRARNSNMAVTKLLDTAELLNAYVSTPIAGVTPNVQGIGRHYMTPYFKRTIGLDFTTKVNSIESHERLGDLKAALLAEVRAAVLETLQSSHYKIALDQYTQFSGRKPKVLIGTDQYLGAYLMIDGDARSYGPDIDYRTVISYDKRIEGKIFITFEAPDLPELSPFKSFGAHAWVPELTSVVQVNRNGATIREAMVQPRNTHIVLNPVLTELRVNMDKFREAAVEKTEAPTIIA